MSLQISNYISVCYISLNFQSFFLRKWRGVTLSNFKPVQRRPVSFALVPFNIWFSTYSDSWPCPSLWVTCSEERSAAKWLQNQILSSLTWGKTRWSYKTEELEEDSEVLAVPARMFFSGDRWVVPQDMLQTRASVPCPHNVPLDAAPPGSTNSRMMDPMWTCGRSWRRPVPTNTRRSPSCTASPTWGACCAGWKRYQRRRRKVKVMSVSLRSIF